MQRADLRGHPRGLLFFWPSNCFIAAAICTMFSYVCTDRLLLIDLDRSCVARQQSPPDDSRQLCLLQIPPLMVPDKVRLLLNHELQPQLSPPLRLSLSLLCLCRRMVVVRHGSCSMDTSRAACCRLEKAATRMGIWRQYCTRG
jgi:hypothetical protein